MTNRLMIITLVLLLSFPVYHSIGYAQEDILEPVVFVPGILGSILTDNKGHVVWGDAVAMVRRFSDLQLSFDKQATTNLRATAILESVGILGPFKVGQYAGIKQTFKDLGFKEGENLFYFPYDWRQSNFDSAAKLAEFINSKKQLSGKKFTIVAHSMGGLVSHIYLRKYGGDKRVSKLVTLGTPHLGSVETFWTFRNGLGSLKNFVVGGDELVRKTVFSFPSMYELLPTYDNCCIVGAPDDADRTPTNILDFETWIRYKWIPAGFEGETARKQIEKFLRSAAQLHELIVSPQPVGVKFIKIGGDLFKTYTRVYVDKSSGKPLRWDQFGGDGTVPLISAAANNLEDTDPAIHVHATIFNDEHVKLKLRRVLTRYNPLEKYAYQPVEGFVEAGAGKLTRVQAINITFGDDYQLAKGNGSLKVTLEGDDYSAVSGVNVRAWIDDAAMQGPALAFQQDSTTGEYMAQYVTPEKVGIHTVFVDIPGLGRFEENFVVLDKQ